MLLKLTSFILFLTPFLVAGQEYFKIQDLKVSVGNQLLTNPWAGGINAAHINSIDVNLDGIEDMVVFEKTTETVYVYLKDQHGEIFLSPASSQKLPAHIHDWMLARDMNGDGKKDILTSHPLGISIYINDLPNGFKLFSSGPLLSKSTSGNINIFVSHEDIPAVHDVDEDGDLDIINFQFSGTTLEFHKNLQIEESLTDTIKFERVAGNWGSIRICACDSFTNSNEPCPEPEDGRTKHSTGHALLLKDVDNDEKADLIFSDSECMDLHMLKNIGSSLNPVFAKERSPFLPMNILMPYPAPFLLDIDDDNDEDLVVSTNFAGLNNTQVDYGNSVWLFRNQGNAQNVNFQFEKADFIQDQMIEVGQNSKAVIFDLDNDGDKDLITGKFLDRSNNYRTGFSYYENIGSYSDPEFQLVTDDLFALSSIFMYNLKPQIVDVNGDRKPDLVFAGTGLYDAYTRIYYYENTGAVNFFTSFDLKELYSGFSFTGNYLIHDIYNDGRMDLLVANTNNVTHFEFTPQGPGVVAENFLSLPAGVYGLEIEDIDGNGNEDFIYSHQGKIKIIYDFESQKEPQDLILLDSENGEPCDTSLGKNLQITAERLLGNNIPELIIGSNKGGFSILKSTEAIPAPIEDELSIFPNPVNVQDYLKLQSKRNLLMFMLSADGKVISGPTYLPAYDIYNLQVDHLAAGVYIIHVIVDNETSWQKKIVITR